VQYVPSCPEAALLRQRAPSLKRRTKRIARKCFAPSVYFRRNPQQTRVIPGPLTSLLTSQVGLVSVHQSLKANKDWSQSVNCRRSTRPLLKNSSTKKGSRIDYVVLGYAWASVDRGRACIVVLCLSAPLVYDYSSHKCRPGT